VEIEWILQAERREDCQSEFRDCPKAHPVCVMGLAVLSLHGSSRFLSLLKFWEQSGIGKFKRERKFTIFKT